MCAEDSTDDSAAIANADEFVDSLLYSFVSPLPSESPAQHLRTFLVHAFASNSGLIYGGSLVKRSVPQAYILKISEAVFITYICLNDFVTLMCLYMFVNIGIGLGSNRISAPFKSYRCVASLGLA